MRVEARNIEDQIQDVNTISKVRRVQRSRRMVKQLQIKGETVEVDAKVVTIEQKLSVKTDHAAGTSENIDICSNSILCCCCDLWNYYYIFLSRICFRLFI